MKNQSLRSKKSITEEEWKKKLTPEQYHVLRDKGTEKPFTGTLLHEKRKGTYSCAGCGQEVFSSKDKFESGTGWPSYQQPANDMAVNEKADRLLWMKRTEIVCSSCGGHLGHVFGDGPAPTGKRYCINSSALTFEKKK